VSVEQLFIVRHIKRDRESAFEPAIEVNDVWIHIVEQRTLRQQAERDSESAVEESAEEVGDDELGESAEADDESIVRDVEGADLAALEELEWRGSGPYDISEVESIESTEESPKIDLGSLILTAVPGSELRLQLAEETGEIVSAMLVLETIVEPPASANQKPQSYSSALELGAYAAPRSGGLWAELRDEISRSATEAGGTASLGEGPFGVELRRLIPVTTPDGEEGYQPSRMWVAEGPRWLLRVTMFGRPALERLDDGDVESALRDVVVVRGGTPVPPGDALPLTMPPGARPAAPSP